MAYKVRVETGGGEGAIGMLSQLPNHGQMSKDGRYCFYMNGEIDNPDFWIIRNKYIKKPTTCHVAKKNTILMLSTPIHGKINKTLCLNVKTLC
jgi:hypothetical protein